MCVCVWGGGGGGGGEGGGGVGGGLKGVGVLITEILWQLPCGGVIHCYMYNELLEFYGPVNTM